MIRHARLYTQIVVSVVTVAILFFGIHYTSSHSPVLSSSYANRDDSVSFFIDGKRTYPDESLFESTYQWHFGIVQLNETVEKIVRVENHSPRNIDVHVIPSTVGNVLTCTPAQKVTIKPNDSKSFLLQLHITKEKWEQELDHATSGWGGGGVIIQVYEKEFDFSFSFWCHSEPRTIEIWNRNPDFRINNIIETEYTIYPYPVIQDGRMYVQFPFFHFHLGYEYQYYYSTNGMTLFMGSNTLYFENGRDNVLVNGIPVHTETLHTIIGGRTVLPLRFLAEYAGYEVMWDPAEEKVTLLWDKY